MFECGRCGSSYSATHLGVEHCPRCQLRDRVQAPLAFKAFQLREAQAAPAEQDMAGAPTVAPASAPAPAEGA